MNRIIGAALFALSLTPALPGPVAGLRAVVRHHNDHGIGNAGIPLGLSPAEVADLVEYLKSL
jgi:hypothetical protein